MTDCNGDGYCLIGLQKSQNSYHISTCIHNCMPVKCPNFLVCGAINPECILNINYGICLSCKVSFNTRLCISNPDKCSLCENTNISVKRLTCDHKICTNCFQKMYFNNKNKISSTCNLCG